MWTNLVRMLCRHVLVSVDAEIQWRRPLLESEARHVRESGAALMSMTTPSTQESRCGQPVELMVVHMSEWGRVLVLIWSYGRP